MVAAVPEGGGEGMIPVILSAPGKMYEIRVSEHSIDAIRRLAKTGGDKSQYCEIAMPDEYHTNVPLAALNQVERMYREGAFV